MARYSRRTGPAADFEAIAANVTIPGMTITRHFDDGELLILAQARFFNGTGGTAGLFTRITVDGVAIDGADHGHSVQAGLTYSTHIHAFVTVAEGIHTIALQCFGSASVGDVVQANRALLTVIQLPCWDSIADML